MEITIRKLDDITPYENNPRNNDQAVDAVAESLKEFGWQQPIVIDADGIIIAGHTRYKAARKLGYETAPVVVADMLTPEQVKAYRLADNKTNEAAEWDFALLDSELAEIMDIDMSAFGFEIDDQGPTADDVQEDNYDPEPPEEPRAKPGDVYQLGRHRVMCGDSTRAADIEILFNGQRPVFVFTDPPYGVAIGSKNKDINDSTWNNKGGIVRTDIAGDTMTTDELYDMLVAAMKNLREHSAADCSYYITSPQGGELSFMMLRMMQDAGLPVRHMLVWVKNMAAFSLGRLDYDYRHEPIFYTWTERHTFYGDYSTSVIDDTTPIDKMSKAELKDLVRALKQEKPDSVIYCDKPVKSELHPTMKPVKLIARLMVNNSRPGDICADIFGGSGSTIIAAEQLDRACYMMEIDPHYVDVIIDRWETFTGEKAVKVS